MYFVKRGGKSINCAGLSFRDFLDGKLSVLPGERPTMSDWADHVSTLFPDVRLKTYIEMRGADSGRLDALCALPALWVGLLYDQESLREAHEWVMERDSSFWQTCAQIVPQDGLSAVVDGVSVQELAQQMVHLAAQGLRRRGRLNDVGQSEEVFVEFLEGIAQSGRSVADRLRDQWEGSEASIRQIFMDQSY
jgi:glutamate--cysteine ligase